MTGIQIVTSFLSFFTAEIRVIPLPIKMLGLKRSPVYTVTHKKTISPVLMIILLVAHFYCTAKIDQAADLLKRKRKKKKEKKKKIRHDEEEERKKEGKIVKYFCCMFAKY